jgi:hypothetical protein
MPNKSFGLKETKIISGEISGPGTIPIGCIVMWYGSSTTSPVIIDTISYPGIPTGWALCDGSTVNGLMTPDLRERFIVGAGGDNSTVSGTTGYNPRDTGGSNDAIVVSHYHDVHTKYLGTLTSGGTGVLSDDNGGTYLGTTTTSEVGSSGTNANRPPYYALAFIMRVS